MARSDHEQWQMLALTRLKLSTVSSMRATPVMNQVHLQQCR